jgi:hypothetical protein
MGHSRSPQINLIVAVVRRVKAAEGCAAGVLLSIPRKCDAQRGNFGGANLAVTNAGFAPAAGAGHSFAERKPKTMKPNSNVIIYINYVT